MLLQLILNGYEVVKISGTQGAKVCSTYNDSSWLTSSRHSIEAWSHIESGTSPLFRVTYSGPDSGEKEVMRVVLCVCVCVEVMRVVLCVGVGVCVQYPARSIHVAVSNDAVVLYKIVQYESEIHTQDTQILLVIIAIVHEIMILAVSNRQNTELCVLLPLSSFKLIAFICFPKAKATEMASEAVAVAVAVRSFLSIFWC